MRQWRRKALVGDTLERPTQSHSLYLQRHAGRCSTSWFVRSSSPPAVPHCLVASLLLLCVCCVGRRPLRVLPMAPRVERTCNSSHRKRRTRNAASNHNAQQSVAHLTTSSHIAAAPHPRSFYRSFLSPLHLLHASRCTTVMVRYSALCCCLVSIVHCTLCESVASHPQMHRIDSANFSTTELLM